MKRRILTVALALVMVFVSVLSFTACNGEEGAESLTVEEIVDRVIEAQGDFQTAQYEMDMTMDMSGEAEGESFEMAMEMDMNYWLDLEAKKMKADMNISVNMPGEDIIDMEMDMEMYIIDEMMYMMMDYPGMGSGWTKSEMPKGTWDSMNQIEPQVELLKTSQVKLAGSEKVRGVDCYVVKVTPDAEQLWSLAMKQANLAGESALPDVAGEVLKDMFRDFSVKQWVAKDTFLLAKAEIEMTMELTAADMGIMGEEGEMAMDIAMSMLAYNYNQPVNIVLPPEAEEAEDMGGMMLP